MFNLVEITANNTLQVRNLVEHEQDGEVKARNFHRYPTSSKQNLSKEPKLVQMIAKEFPYIEDVVHPDGIHEDVSMIRVMAESQTQFRYDITVHVVKNGETVLAERKPPFIVKAFDDVSQLPVKVQKIAGLLFTDEFKAEILTAAETEAYLTQDPILEREQAEADELAEQKRIAAEKAEIKRLAKEKAEAVDKAAEQKVEKLRLKEKKAAAKKKKERQVAAKIRMARQQKERLEAKVIEAEKSELRFNAMVKAEVAKSQEALIKETVRATMEKMSKGSL